MEEEVLYQTCTHASRPYVSNYPPQISKRNESGKGIISSLFSAPGLSQIKEKWREYKSPMKIKKPISLIISGSGERVAVVTGNQITILWKEDNYQEPCGIFTGLLGVFSFGVWSESHDILGIIDDTGTLYFIKVNGEEITRITKRQLKAALPVVCMIPQENTNANGSCLCSFIVLTADGFLHHIEIGRHPTVSTSSKRTLNNGLIQFPKDVYCFDYDCTHCLLVVVGNSSGNSGSCQLSLWHRRQTTDLEPLSSFDFEGLYCKAKDFLDSVTYPKVLISPEANFVATLDITGKLYIFKLDKEQLALPGTAVGGKLSLQEIKNLKDEQKELLNDNMEFTWWSDRIVTLARRDGVITMLDILSGSKLQKNDPMYSMPVLDRVRKLQGHLFLVDSKSSEERRILSDYSGESMGLHHLQQVTEKTRDQHDLSKLLWRLISISQRSVPEMYDILISNREYEAALQFANQHGLDRDEVLKSQWLYSCQGVNDIHMFLSNIKDQGFVLSECLNKVLPTEDAMKALLAHGLCTTDQYRFSGEKHHSNQIWDLRLSRLELLQYRDRLETYLGINMGRFSMQEYSKCRVVSLSEAAVTLAESGKIGALNLLFKRHPYSLSPSILKILSAVPETVPVQTYGQLLPGRLPPTGVSLREEDWVECEEMLNFIKNSPKNLEFGIHIRTEPIVKRFPGYIWPSANELSTWYMNRARDIDSYSGQLDNCLCLIDLACRKGIFELQQFHEDISYLHQLIYSDESETEICFNIRLLEWEQLSDYEKFRMMLKEAKEENIVKKLQDKAIPFMRSRFHYLASVTEVQVSDGHLSLDHKDESFIVRWLKEIALENKVDICLIVIEEGCRELPGSGYFKDEIEAVDCGLQCIYLCTLTDKWSTLAAILSKLPQKQDAETYSDGLEERLKLAEGHIEAGRLLAFYQVPKSMNFFLEACADEKGVKQIVRLMLSKFVRRNPGRSDNDWASMWRDMQSLRDKAFPFLDPEYMLTEFCRGLLKAGRFSLARNYLKGTSSVALASEKAENLVIQAAREFFFSASSLSCSEIWKAKECLNLFPSSRQVKAEADVIEVLTVKLPSLGVTLLPLQFRQIRDPMEIVKMAITSQPGAYLHVDELIDVAKLLGLNTPEDISAVEEAIAREAAVAGDLQLAFDLCLVLAKKGHGLIWDLCAAIARGPALENMDVYSRKQLLGFALSHCDSESIGELLHAWKDLDMQGQCDTLLMSSGMSSPNFPALDSSIMSLPVDGIQDIVDFSDCSNLVDGDHDHEAYLTKVKNTLSFVAKNLPMQNGIDMESFLRENGKIFSFAVFQLPWLLDLSMKPVNAKKPGSDFIPRKQYFSTRTQALVTILSWLARNGFAPKDDVIASVAKSIMEPPVTEEEDIIGCSLLLNLVDAFTGVEVIEEQLKIRKNYQEICSIMTLGMTYSSLHNFEVECNGPSQRRELLLREFMEKHMAFISDEMNKIDEVQSTFWRQWKFKLEEKRHVAEHSRLLEQIIPGVETARFLSGDLEYVESVIFALIDSVKAEKKHIIRNVLKLADTYGLNHTEVLQRFLSSVLVSDVWTNDDIMSEISELKEELFGCAPETIKTIFSVVYPAIDGYNKQRLAYIYGLLSDCFSQLEETKQSLQGVHFPILNSCTVDLAGLYKILGQECLRVSFIKDLDFKNVAGLDGLNLQSLRSEVYAHINDLNLEALAKMVQTLAGIYKDSVPENLMAWQDVYKHYVLSLLTTLETTRKEFNFVNPETFQEFIIQLESIYDFSRLYIRLLAPSDAMEILKRYLTAIVPLHASYGSIPDNSAWQDCLIILLNFWLRLTEEIQEIASNESPENVVFHPECLSSCLKVLMKLVMEDIVSPSQCWGSIFRYVTCGLIGDFSVEILSFCKAMIFSGCGFGAISEVFSEATSLFGVGSSPAADSESQDLPHLYIKILEPILKDLVSGSNERQNLYNLLSSLSKLEGQVEDLQKVRQAVWGRMAQFSDNSQLLSHVRVYVLELMQLTSGKNLKGFSTELQSIVVPWEGWDKSLFTCNKEPTADHGSVDLADTSSQLTNTLVALKSSQLVAAISPDIEITPDDLLNVETAVSCFLKLCEVSNSDTHVEVLLAILEEWEGFFIVNRDETNSPETSEAVNDWNTDDWDEGWESFQEEESLEKEKTENSFPVDPLHTCWMQVFKKYISMARFSDISRLMDRSLTKSNLTLLDEDDAKTLCQVLLEMDCFMALKLALLLPYEALQFHCLGVVDDKLKQDGISETVGRDHEFLILALSSGIMPAILTKSSYGTTFSYLCYLAGNFCRQYQESQLPSFIWKEKKGHDKKGKEFIFLFRRILFPCFIAELVKADQQILAGFLVTKFMHTNSSLKLINVAEASLARYLERQLHALEEDEIATDEASSCKILRNAVSRLKGRSRNEIQSALSLLPANAR